MSSHAAERLANRETLRGVKPAGSAAIAARRVIEVGDSGCDPGFRSSETAPEGIHRMPGALPPGAGQRARA